MAAGDLITQPDGSIVRDNGDGTGTVVGYSDAPIGGPNPDYQVDSRTVDSRVADTAADARNSSAQAAVNEATIAAQIRRANADAAKAEADARTASQTAERGGTTSDMAETRRAQISRLEQLTQQINRTQELFNSGPGSTGGVLGLLDYLPTDANAAFDVAGASLAQQGLAAFRVPGTGTVSDRDAIMFDRANLPTSSTRDSAVQEQLSGMRERVEAEYRSLGLGEPQWQNMPSALDQISMGQPQARAASGGGAQTTTTAMPEEMQAEHAQLVARLLQEGGGRIDPQAYAAGRAALDDRYGFATDDDRHEVWAAQFNDAIGGGGGGTVPPIPPLETPLSDADQLWNDVASSPLGTGAANVLDAGAFGLVSMLNPEAMGAANNLNPTAATIGQIGGAITGTGMLSRLGRETAGRVAPGIFGGGRGAQFGRNLAGDVAYSGIYGANTGQDPGMSMLAGGVGSAGGQLVGKALGGLASGAVRSPSVEYLANRNIPLTAGQTLGGLAGRMEERAMSLPGIGDMIRNRRVDSMEEFGREAFRQGGEPIGFNPTAIGQEGLGQLEDAIGGAYTRATSGARVPLDAQFSDDLQAVGGLSRMLPEDHQGRFAQVMNNRVQPIMQAGEMTGDAFQQAQRGIRGSRASASGAAPGFEQEYRDALTAASDALTSQMQRGGAPEVVEGLNAANAANRNFRTLEDASTRAAGGSVTDAPFEFSPNMLQRAGLRTQNNFPGPRPFAELADAGAEVLPNRVPNSASADRLMQAGALGGLTTIGAGAGYAAGGDPQAAAAGATIPTLLTVLAMMGGTKAGQQAITGAITARPERLRAAGQWARRNSGLFGSASIPLALPSN